MRLFLLLVGMHFDDSLAPAFAEATAWQARSLTLKGYVYVAPLPSALFRRERSFRRGFPASPESEDAAGAEGQKGKTRRFRDCSSNLSAM